MAEALDVSVGTVFRIKRRFAEDGLEGALLERPRPRPRRKLDDKGEAHLIALACSPAPEGHDHWTLRLLTGKVVELGLVSSMSHEGVRKRLKKTPLSPNPPKDTDGRREDSGRMGEGATGEMAGLHWGRLEVGGRSSVAA